MHSAMSWGPQNSQMLQPDLFRSVFQCLQELVQNSKSLYPITDQKSVYTLKG